MKVIRHSVLVPLILALVGSLALADKITAPSGQVTDSSGTTIGTFTTQGSGQYFDYDDDPSQNHPPNTDASLTYDVPEVGDPYTDTTDGSPPFEYDVVFTPISPTPSCVDGWKKTHKWEKKSRATGQVVDSGYIKVPC